MAHDPNMATAEKMADNIGDISLTKAYFGKKNEGELFTRTQPISLLQVVFELMCFLRVIFKCMDNADGIICHRALYGLKSHALIVLPHGCSQNVLVEEFGGFSRKGVFTYKHFPENDSCFITIRDVPTVPSS